MYPNPAINETVITWSKPLANGSIVVFDATGNKVIEQKINADVNKATLDLNRFEKGIYFVVLTSEAHEVQKTQLLKIK